MYRSTCVAEVRVIKVEVTVAVKEEMVEVLVALLDVVRAAVVAAIVVAAADVAAADVAAAAAAVVVAATAVLLSVS